MSPAELEAALDGLPQHPEGDGQGGEPSEPEPSGDDLGPEDSPEDPDPEPEPEDPEDGEDPDPEPEDGEGGDGDDGTPQDEEVVYEVIIDGDKYEVTEEELVNSYQHRGMVTQKRMRDAEIHRNAMAQVTQKEQMLDEKLAIVEKYLSGANDEFDYDAVAELPLEQQKAAFQKWADDRKMKDAVAQERQQLQQSQQQEMERQRRLIAMQERVNLLQAVPEWQDENTMRSEMGAISTFAQQQLGFGNEELRAIAMDHRSILALRYAKRGYEAERGIKTVKNKVRKVNRVKPGGKSPGKKAPTDDFRSSDDAKKLRKRMRAGDQEAALDYIAKTRPDLAW